MQNAYDRLRKYGTEYYEYMPTTPNYPLPSSPLITTDITNGFFVRDDVPYWDYIFPGYAPTAKYYNHFNRPYLVNTLPYKAVISHSGEIIHEQYFSTRAEAEIYIVETLQGLKESAGDVIAPK